VISEVVEDLAVHAMPNTASWFAGMVNLRGNLIPVFDLHVLIGSRTETLGRLLVIDRGDRAAAVPIDALPRPVDPQHRSSHMPPVPADIEPFVRRAHLDRGEIWLELDFSALFESLGARAGG
jgi:twitching motility protein PilI